MESSAEDQDLEAVEVGSQTDGLVVHPGVESVGSGASPRVVPWRLPPASGVRVAEVDPEPPAAPTVSRPQLS